MTSDMRRMADFAEQLWLMGHSAASIAGELRSAADADEFGWTGAKHFGATAGLIPLDEADMIRSDLETVLDADNRKTVSKEAVRGALND